MQRFARVVKSLGVVARPAVPASASAARGMALFLNRPPAPTDCKDVVAEQLANKRHAPLAQQTKTAMEYIAAVPVIEVAKDVAICDGGDTFGGHPRVYIQLNKSKGGAEACKYCGLRYIMKHDHHH